MSAHRTTSGAGWIWAVIAVASSVALVGVVSEPQRGFGGLLVAAMFGLTIALGGAIFLALTGVVNASWNRPLTTLPVDIAGTMATPTVALVIVLLLGVGSLYPWAQEEMVSASHLIQIKTAWLNVPFFLVRAVVVLCAWFGMVAALRARVRRPAAPGASLRKLSALFLVVLAPTLSIAFWDWTMSLEPEWFSTMWAVYGFAGAFPAGIAAIVLLMTVLRVDERLSIDAARALRHDLGKLLFGFTSFWAYIWFCQYMLIWYANLPEEATWFAHRTGLGWSALFWLNPVLNWAVPFFVLMAVEAKKDRGVLAQVSLVVLAGHWLDIYLMVGPAQGPSPGVPVFAFAATIAVVAGMCVQLRRRYADAMPA